MCVLCLAVLLFFVLWFVRCVFMCCAVVSVMRVWFVCLCICVCFWYGCFV